MNKHVLCLVFVRLARNSAQRATDPFVCFFVSDLAVPARMLFVPLWWCRGAILSLKSLDGWCCGKPRCSSSLHWVVGLSDQVGLRIRPCLDPKTQNIKIL